MSNANIYRFEGPNSLWKGAKYLLDLVAEGLSAALAISGEDDPLVAALLSAESGIPLDSLLTGNVPSGLQAALINAASDSPVTRVKATPPSRPDDWNEYDVVMLHAKDEPAELPEGFGRKKLLVIDDPAPAPAASITRFSGPDALKEAATIAVDADVHKLEVGIFFDDGGVLNAALSTVQTDVRVEDIMANNVPEEQLYDLASALHEGYIYFLPHLENADYDDWLDQDVILLLANDLMYVPDGVTANLLVVEGPFPTASNGGPRAAFEAARWQEELSYRVEEAIDLLESIGYIVTWPKD